MAKKYQIEVDVTLTVYVEVEANDEDQALSEAYDEANSMKIGDAKQWESTGTVKNVAECCENCGEEKDVDIEPLVDYQGHRLCPDCVDYYNQCPDEFRQIFKD